MSNGIIGGICIATVARGPMKSVTEVLAIAGQGLEGDRYATGNGSYNQGKQGMRQVTLINHRFFLRSGFTFPESRRGILVRGTELMCLIGKKFKIGDAVMCGIKYCEPCKIPSVLSNNKFAFDDRFHDCGGLIAAVIQTGMVRLDDAVVPPRKNY